MHHYRSIFISDVHLGLRDCQARYLLDFLSSTRCERMYLVGDIVDFENMERTPYWHTTQSAVLARLFAIAASGTKITYIPGNHDAALRRFVGQRLAGIDIAQDAVHVAADGRRYKVSHGDEFDGDHVAPRGLVKLGDVMQRFVSAINRHGNMLRKLMRLRYAPISIAIKMNIPTARRFIEHFEDTVTRSARANGFDGHICGHIHRGHIADHDDVVYINDGDWVEHCTALVEHRDGRFELLHWTDRPRILAVSAPVQPIADALPAAA
ncbi:MAG TPA: UDP-2,3-diacylglucosamine diphosphatase [Rudaea sp.]|jgi:UDP-2,3-diacylglucosamine pyrophosphatase LpxH|nr:UDP-2,3-diacylglucosamine diphosphatase [Rudaea sp.]